jgi:predicted alpha/beta superfamily hydrolase
MQGWENSAIRVTQFGMPPLSGMLETMNVLDHRSIGFHSTEKTTEARAERNALTTRRVLIGDRPEHTLIVLDDELIGDLCVASARAMAAQGSIPSIEIVGVGMGEADLAELSIFRAANYTFEQGRLDGLGWSDTGHADEFRDFLARTVLPECTLPKAHRTIVGYSLSGSFALQAAQGIGDQIGAIAAISPSIWAEPATNKAALAAYRADPELRVFLMAGALENDAALTGLSKHMWEIVRDLGKDLAAVDDSRVWTQVYDGETHFSIPFRCVCDLLPRICSLRQPAAIQE